MVRTADPTVVAPNDVSYHAGRQGLFWQTLELDVTREHCALLFVNVCQIPLLKRCPVLVWKRSLAGVLFFRWPAVRFGSLLPRTLVAQESPPGKANELRAQLEKLQSALREVELKDEQRGKVTEIGSSRGRLRETDEPRLVVKVYDLSDLFTVAPTYPAYEPTELLRAANCSRCFRTWKCGQQRRFGGGFGGGGGGMFAVPNAPERPTFARCTSHAASSQRCVGLAGFERANLNGQADRHDHQHDRSRAAGPMSAAIRRFRRWALRCSFPPPAKRTPS